MVLPINARQSTKLSSPISLSSHIEWLDPTSSELPIGSQRVTSDKIMRNIENCDSNAYGALKGLISELRDNSLLSSGYCSWLAVHRGLGNHSYNSKLPLIIGQILAKMCEPEVLYGTQKEN